MLRLNLTQEAQWLDLGHGVEILVAPMTTALMMAARKEAQGLIAQPVGVGESDAEGGGDDIALAMARAVARVAIRDWKGVGDDNGLPIPLSPEGIDALLDLWPIFEASQTRFVGRAVILEQEKNGSAPSPNGTSAGARTIARPAGTPARTARKG